MSVIAWVGSFSLIGTIMVMKDKQKARQHRHRIPEKRLMWMGVLGGALLMWLTMILVHHKTHRNKFMRINISKQRIIMNHSPPPF